MNKLKLILLFVSFIFLTPKIFSYRDTCRISSKEYYTAKRIDTLSLHAMRMLSVLNASVMKHVNSDKDSPDYGGIYCPHCKLYHTRAAETVYPFAYEYHKMGNKT